MYLPGIKLETDISLTRRMQFLGIPRKAFRAKWMLLIFGKMIPAGKWKKEQAVLKEGTMVLEKEELMAPCDNTMDEVEKVFIGSFFVLAVSTMYSVSKC